MHSAQLQWVGSHPMGICTEHRLAPSPDHRCRCWWVSKSNFLLQDLKLPSQRTLSLDGCSRHCPRVFQRQAGTWTYRGDPLGLSDLGAVWGGHSSRGSFTHMSTDAAFYAGENFDLSRTNWNVIYYPMQPRAASTWAGIPQDTTGVLWKQGLREPWVGSEWDFLTVILLRISHIQGHVMYLLRRGDFPSWADLRSFLIEHHIEVLLHSTHVGKKCWLRWTKASDN